MPCDNVLFRAAIGIYHSKRNAFVLNHNNLYLHITVKELSIGLLVVFIFTKLYEHGISLPIPILLYACISAAVCKLSFNYYSKQLKISMNRSDVLNNLKCICTDLMLFSIICQLLIMLCGDVEKNPGPVPGDSFNNSYHTDSFSSVSIHQSSCGLKLVHLNIRSLLPKLDHLSVELSYYDIIAVSETFLDPSVTNEQIFLEGFQAPFRNDRNRHGGGVAVYVKNHISASRLGIFNHSSLESIWLKIRNKNNILYFNCTYRPPSSSVEFWDELYECVCCVKDLNMPPIIIMGDLNSDYFNETSEIRRFCDVTNLHQLIKEPTRVPSNTLIDHILTDIPNNHVHTGVMDPFCSDHKPIFTCLDFKIKHSQSFKRKVWKYDEGDYDKFRFELSKISWTEIFSNETTLECKALTFTNILLNIASLCIPNKTCTIRPNDKPWMHNEIRHEIRIRRRIHKLAKRTNSDYNWSLYRSQRNKVCYLIKISKSNYYDKLCKSLHNHSQLSSKKWWNVCKYMYNGRYNNHIIPPIHDADNILSENIDKAEAFNSFFTSISNLEENKPLLPPLPLDTPSNLDNITITQSDIKDVLTLLKSSKASGPDGINQRILKEVAQFIIKPLCTLFNMSLREKYFPTCWKKSNVIPLFKKSDASKKENYRSISLLSCISKVFEKCVFKHTFNYLLENKILSSNQSAYHPGDSSVCQLVTLYHDLCSSLDNGNDVQMIFFDISKAFDRVWHAGLVHKL